MTKLIEAINNIVKLIGSLLSLGLILAVLGVGYLAYTHLRNLPIWAVLGGFLGGGEAAPATPPPPPQVVMPTREEMFGEQDDQGELMRVQCFHVKECTDTNAHYYREMFETCVHTPYCRTPESHMYLLSCDSYVKCRHKPRCESRADHWKLAFREFHTDRKRKLRDIPLPKPDKPELIDTERDTCPHKPKCNGFPWVCLIKIDEERCQHEEPCTLDLTYLTNHRETLFQKCKHEPKCQDFKEHMGKLLTHYTDVWMGL